LSICCDKHHNCCSSEKRIERNPIFTTLNFAVVEAIASKPCATPTAAAREENTNSGKNFIFLKVNINQYLKDEQNLFLYL